MAEDAVRVFISYSHRDETLRLQLDKHLAPLKGQKVIESWHDRQIQAGMEWADQIDDNLNKADIILLLVSPDFVASDYCFKIELIQAIKRHESGEAIVVPIILEPCDWSWLPFAKFQAFPKDAKAITTWANSNEAFLDVATGIRKVAQELFAKRKLLAEQKQADRARYLQKVEEVLSDGVISIVERDTLDELRETLGLTPEEAREIETRAYEPYSRVEENLNKYKQTLNRLIEKCYYPFSEEIQKDLENRQRDLGLKPEDAARISKPILDQAELNYQAQKKKLTEEEKLQALERQRQREQEESEAQLDRCRQEFSRAIQADYLFNENDVNDEINQQVTRGSSDADIGAKLLTNHPLAVVPIEEVEPTTKISVDILTQTTQPNIEIQAFPSKDEIVFSLINRLFDILSGPNAEMAIQNFEAIAHHSLFHNGQIDPSFRKNCFNVAITRLNLYRRPIEVTMNESTGRTRLGLRGNKEDGKEEKYMIARKDNLGGLEGHIRIFFPADSNPAKISGFNL